MDKFKDGENPWEDANSLVYDGSRYANANNKHLILDGAKISCGKLERSTDCIKGHDIYNECIVKNANLVRIDYIIKLKKVR